MSATSAVYVVYWCEIAAEKAAGATSGNDARQPALSPRAQSFPAGGLSDALAFAETLRRRQARDGTIGFVSLCSENPQSVGPAGAADPPANYDWKKRRR